MKIIKKKTGILAKRERSIELQTYSAQEKRDHIKKVVIGAGAITKVYLFVNGVFSHEEVYYTSQNNT